MKSFLPRSTPIFLAFLIMGFGDVSGPLTSQLQAGLHTFPCLQAC